MRRTFGHYGALAVALLALATWSGNSFAGDKDSSDDTQSGAKESSSDDSQPSKQTTNDRRSQDRDKSDSDVQHHAVLGISMLESDGHVRVVAIMPGSPAAKAGLQVGDEIRSVDDQRIRTTEGLTDEICEKQPGATVELSIRRNGERSTLHARLANAQEPSGNRGRTNRQYASNDDNYNRGNRQNGGNRNRASSYDPDTQSGSQSVSQQLRTLRQQIAQLQEEVDDLRNQSASGARVGSRNR